MSLLDQTALRPSPLPLFCHSQVFMLLASHLIAPCLSFPTCGGGVWLKRVRTEKKQVTWPLGVSISLPPAK